MQTQSGQYTIFHRSEAAQPSAYAEDGWYFEPAEGLGLDVFSSSFPAAEAALAAAEQWEDEEERSASK